MIVSTNDYTDYYTEAKMKQAEFKGWCACLDAVRASLRGYPNAGGDIEIMKEVERLIRESTRTVTIPVTVPGHEGPKSFASD